jgi:PIN domain nuclease of toxin-antitoxin system
LKILADTEVILWWLTDDPRLSLRARTLLRDTDVQVFWSMASALEVSILVSSGKMHIDGHLEPFFAMLLQEQNLTPLPITQIHCAQLARLPRTHLEPIDRLLVAQSMVEDIPLLTANTRLGVFDVELVW